MSRICIVGHEGRRKRPRAGGSGRAISSLGTWATQASPRGCSGRVLSSLGSWATQASLPIIPKGREGASSIRNMRAPGRRKRPRPSPHHSRPYAGGRHITNVWSNHVYRGRFCLHLTTRVIERREIFMFNTAIRSTSVLVYCFSCAAFAAGDDYRTNNRMKIKIKIRCTDENITQEASAFG
jgi:hypothetical protein